MRGLHGAAFLAALPPAVAIVDRERKVVQANPAVARLVGVSAEELEVDAVSAALFDPVPGAEPSVLLDAFDRALAGRTVRVEHVTVATARGVVHRTAWLSPVPAAGEEAAHVLILFSVEEERFQALLENTTDVITVLDVEGTIRYSNPAAGRLMGFETGTVLAGTSGFDLVHPDDRERARAALRDRISRTDAGRPEELRIRHGDGSWRAMEVSLANLTAHAGVAGLVVTLHDVDDRRRAQDELRRSEARFRSLVENLHDVIVVLDERAVVTYASPAMERIIGAPASTNVGTSAFNDVHPEDLDGARKLVEDVMAGPDAVARAELRLHHVVDDRWLWVDVTAVNRLADPVVGGIVCTLRDVTGLRQAEHVKDEFLATISHELRTPLTAIVGFADLLRRDPEVDPAVRDTLLERLAVNADQTKEMVEQILSFSRLEAGRALVEPVPLVVADAVRRSVADLAAQLSDHRVEVEAADDLVALADAGALGHILRNLLGNAALYSRPGTRIRVVAERSGGLVAVGITDEGPGIEDDDVPRLFERFYRGDGRPAGRRGTGLGLSIARRYVELLGGRIWVDTRVGAGSTFTFTLPAALAG